MSPDTEIAERYAAALDALVEKLQQDPYILAAVLIGSLSHDVVWRKSDIDLFLITDEVKLQDEGFSLVEDGIDIHASLMTRNTFRRLVEGSRQSSFIHSALERGRFLFTRDETLRELWSRGEKLGSQDRAVQLLQGASRVLPALAKAEKWLVTRRDVEYTFHWLMKCVDGLATVEANLHGETAGREVIQQALKLHPDFFHAIYTDLIHSEKSLDLLRARVEMVRSYLLDRAPQLFAPLLEHLVEMGTPQSASDLEHHFSRHLGIEGVTTACEWLADEGVLGKASAPRRLTPKSRISVEEAAYYYDGQVPA